jgi:hypothetical protein
VCCGGSDVLLEARRWGLPVECGGIGVKVIRTGPEIEPVRSSVHWFTGLTV